MYSESAADVNGLFLSDTDIAYSGSGNIQVRVHCIQFDFLLFLCCCMRDIYYVLHKQLMGTNDLYFPKKKYITQSQSKS